MPPYGPVHRRVLVQSLKRAGFTGPYPGSNHSIMWKGTTLAIIPNPHRGDISVDLWKKVLKQAQISREEWEKL